MHVLHKYGRPCWLLEQHVEWVLPYLDSANCTGTRASPHVFAKRVLLRFELLGCVEVPEN